MVEVARTPHSVRHAATVISNDDLPQHCLLSVSQTWTATSARDLCATESMESDTSPKERIINQGIQAVQSGGQTKSREQQTLISLIDSTSQKIADEDDPGRRSALQEILNSYEQRMHEIGKHEAIEKAGTQSHTNSVAKPGSGSQR